MRVIVGCESSGRVRNAFRKYGHDAWSCDLQPADDGSRHHYQEDIFALLDRTEWDLMICHPTCQYLSSSGLFRNKNNPERQAKTEEAVEFAKRLYGANIPKIAMENPIGRLSTTIGSPAQIIHPYQFGDDASKSTCLWLKNLEPLKGTQFVMPRMVCVCVDTPSTTAQINAGVRTVRVSIKHYPVGRIKRTVVKTG